MSTRRLLKKNGGDFEAFSQKGIAASRLHESLRKRSPVLGVGKAIFCMLIFFSSTQMLLAQAPYLGGSGDGYDMGSTLVSVAWDITEFDSLTVFPNLVAPGDVVYIAVQGIRKKLEIVAHDGAGKLVWKTTQWDLDPSVLVEMPTENLAAGVYVLEIRVDGVAQQRKIVVQRR